MTDRPPLLAEDLLLLLLDPGSGAIRAEGTNLFHALAGAVLAQLSIEERVVLDDRGFWRGTAVTAAGDPPTDPLLREVWDDLAGDGVELRTLVLSLGPRLREPVLERLVEHGHVLRIRRKVLGLIPSTRLVDGGTSRRGELLGAVRRVLVDGEEGDAAASTLAALLSASGALPTMHPEIRWSGDVHDRGKRLEAGEWGVAAAADAVAVSTATLLASTLVAATTVAAATDR